MQQAVKLLFEHRLDGNPLFTSQLDLVNTLLGDSRTKYHVNQKEVDKYTKAQTRLKTYISQLLSTTVSRSITEDFKEGLQIAIASRMQNNPSEVEKVVNSVVSAIEEKNLSLGKNELKPGLTDQFGVDFYSANYIAVITSRPLEVDYSEKANLPPLRRYLFSDLIQRLYDKEKDLKYYRFNFPTESFGQLFWRLLKRVLLRQFKSNPSPELIESLYSKFAIKTETVVTLKEYSRPSEEQIEAMVNETLQQLNHNRYIMVFTTTAPIYGLPLVAMNPSDTKQIKVYAMLESDAEKMSLFKFPESETLLWRLFVWDTLKSKRFAGQSMPFVPENI